MLIHNVWTKAAPPAGMGGPGMSNTLTPAHHGEDRSNPARSHFLLGRGCCGALGRMASPRPSRGARAFFVVEALRLERDVRAYQPQADRLLGDAKASTLFLNWAPDVAARVCYRPTSSHRREPDV